VAVADQRCRGHAMNIHGHGQGPAARPTHAGTSQALQCCCSQTKVGVDGLAASSCVFTSSSAQSPAPKQQTPKLLFGAAADAITSHSCCSCCCCKSPLHNTQTHKLARLDDSKRHATLRTWPHAGPAPLLPHIVLCVRFLRLVYKAACGLAHSFEVILPGCIIGAAQTGQAGGGGAAAGQSSTTSTAQARPPGAMDLLPTPPPPEQQAGASPA